MAYLVTTDIVTVCIVMAYVYGLYSYGLYSHGLYSYGLYVMAYIVRATGSTIPSKSISLFISPLISYGYNDSHVISYGY